MTPRAFQQAFGAALAGRRAVADPTLARALAVHRNTATKAAADALAANFPVVRALVGDDAFAAAARAFVEASPPGEPRLCLYGAPFAAFLADYHPFAALDYLADVARVERLVVEALFAADADPIAPHALDLSLEGHPALHPALRVATLASPATSIWLAHQPGATLALDAVVWAPETALVTRPAGTVTVAAVPAGTAPFFAALAASLPLGAAAEAAGNDLAEVFAVLVASGAFIPSGVRS